MHSHIQTVVLLSCLKTKLKKSNNDVVNFIINFVV